MTQIIHTEAATGSPISSTLHDMRVRASERTTAWIAFAGAAAYNSWPAAFLTDRRLAGRALASSFEGHGQPFDWLFILLDCIAGTCIDVVCLRGLRPSRPHARVARGIVFALLAYGIFGTATAADALVPLDCGSASAQACASRLWPPTPDDLLTGTAVLALFAAAVAVIVQMAKLPAAFKASTRVVLTASTGIWSAVGIIVLTSNADATTSAECQYAFLTLTSTLSFVVPLSAARLKRGIGGDDAMMTAEPEADTDPLRTLRGTRSRRQFKTPVT